MNVLMRCVQLNWYVFYAIVFVINSCNNFNSEIAEGDINKIMEIDPRTFSDAEFTLSSIAEDIEYVPLDNSILIKEAEKIRVIKNSVYIGNYETALIKFSIEGKNLKKIGNIGRGPEEYSHSNIFTVDINNEDIYLRGPGGDILVFSSNGEFIRTIKLPDGIVFEDVEFLNSEFLIAQYITRGQAKNKWVIIDTTGSILSEKSNPIPPFDSRLGTGGGIFKFENNISYWGNYYDTIFTIYPDFSYKASIVFKQGEHRFPRQDPEFDEQLKYFRVMDIFETNNFLVFKYMYNYLAAIAFVDKMTRKVQLSQDKWEFRGIQNDLDAGLIFQPETYYTNNEGEFLIGLVHAYQLKYHVSSDDFINTIPKYPEKKKELAKLAAHLDENNNPVLMLVKLKKFNF
jgi:hypothetical protein